MASVLRSRALFSFATVLSATLFGCAGHAGAGGPISPHEERLQGSNAAQGGVDFGAAVHDFLLAAPGSQERRAGLASVMNYQFKAAASLFAAHSIDRGLAATVGALALVRHGEFTAPPFGDDDAGPLRAAAREFSVRGDEGRARAFYELVLRTSKDEAAKAEAKDHLAAITTWLSSTAGGTGTASAGGIERAAVNRRLIEPSQAAIDDAAFATTEWLHRAISLRAASNHGARPPAREDAREAYRALETAPLVLAAIYLRDADAEGARAALDAVGGAESAPQGFYDSIRNAAGSRSPEHWADLLAHFDAVAGRSEPQENEFSADRDLFQAATFGIALELHRLDPANIQAALHLAVALSDFQMGESAPSVLAEAVAGHSAEPLVVSEALEITANAMANAALSDDAASARRTFNAAAPLLQIAEQRAMIGRVHPSAAQVRERMGDIELEQGRLDDAKTDLVAAVTAESSPLALLSLSRIEAHDSQFGAAIARLKLAIAGTANPAIRGELQFFLSDISLSAGDAAGAKIAIASSVRDLLAARQNSSDPASVQAERTLSRALDRLGEVEGAQRALERALANNSHNKVELAQTLGLVIERALVRNDLEAAEHALGQAASSELDQDDLVYFALRVAFIEHIHHLPTGVTAAQIFSRIGDDSRWISALARFGEKKLTLPALLARASTPIQKIEATFYGALERRAGGDGPGSIADLESVAKSVGLELTETALARELLTGGASSPALGRVPSDLVVP